MENLKKSSPIKVLPVPWDRVGPLEGFWGARQKICMDVTLPIQYRHCVDTGRVDAIKERPNADKSFVPHHFWDSDIAKWIEAAAYSLTLRPDTDLENKVDEIVGLIEAAQMEDGYFNSYYAANGLENRFTDLKNKHELYCLGHMIEGAAAYYQVTGKRRLLDVVCRYADLISRVLGDGKDQLPGYDGHEEIELALVKLFHATGQEKYLNLSRSFVDRRGTQPHFFDEECERRGEEIPDRKYRFDMQGSYAYYQAHLPVRRQDRAVGHAVRATYLYCAMADLAAETGDPELLRACRDIWDNIVSSQLFITGGIGPNPNGERFTYEYNLVNEMAYNETCASIGLFLFAHRMMGMEPSGIYGDVMERCIFNNIAGGISLTGDRFYYANPLAVHPAAYLNMNEDKPQITLERQKWFYVSCCPPNLARLTMSLGSYIYYRAEDAVYISQYMDSAVSLNLGGGDVAISQKSGYPWDGKISVAVNPASPAEFALCLRLPAWSAGNWKVLCNGAPVEHTLEKGFVTLRRRWEAADTVELTLDMRVRVTEARPEVAADCGRVALERGPLVYCFEEADNGANLHDLQIDTATINESFHQDLLGGVVAVRGRAARRNPGGWPKDQLYREWIPEDREEMMFAAIPFYARLNRTPGEMVVWALPTRNGKP